MRQRSGLPNVLLCSNKQSFPLSVRDRDRDGACTSTAALPYLCAVSGNSWSTSLADGRSNCHCRANQATSSARKAMGQCNVLGQDDMVPDFSSAVSSCFRLHWLPYMEQKATRRVQEASRKSRPTVASACSCRQKASRGGHRPLAGRSTRSQCSAAWREYSTEPADSFASLPWSSVWSSCL